MTKDELIDDLGEQLYLYRWGAFLHDGFEEAVTGKKPKLWKIRYPFEKDEEVVEQWQKDDFKWMAQHLLDRLNYHGLVDYEVVKGSRRRTDCEKGS